MVELDTSNGVMFPLYDPDANLIYLCGKVSRDYFYLFRHISLENLEKSRPKISANEMNQFNDNFVLDIFHFKKVKF